MSSHQLLAYFDRIAEAPGAVPRLRQFILDLAVRGKLVEQDPGDEPATAAIDSLAVRRASLMRSGNLRSIKTLQRLESTVPFAPPLGWCWATPDQLSGLVNSALTIGPFGSNLLTSDYRPSGVPLVFVADIRSEFRDPPRQYVSIQKAKELSSHSTGPGDLLITKMGDPPGDTAIYPDHRPRALITADCIKWTVDQTTVLPRYLYFALRASSVRAQISQITKGAVHQKVSLRRFRGVHVPVPPRAQQHRIVAKMDELMALCDRLEAAQAERERRRDGVVSVSLKRLGDPEAPHRIADRVQAVFSHLRTVEHLKEITQAILALAVRGKLVKQDLSDESAMKLMESIPIRQKLDNPSRARSQQEPTGSKSALKGLFEVPDTWIWTTLGQITNNIHYGYTASANWFPEGGPRLLRISDIQDNAVNWSALPGCTIQSSDIEQYRLSPGDILVARTGGTLGKTFLVIDAPVEAVFASYLIRIQPFASFSARYLKVFLESPVYWEQLEEGTRGGGQPNVNARTLSSLLVPIPPAAEQCRIVAKLDELMALCERLEAKLSGAQDGQRRLLDAVLQKVLTGDAEQTTAESCTAPSPV